jgi:hypothetical protein
LAEAISVRKGWNSTLGNGRVISLTSLPPPFSKASLKPATDSSPKEYFQVTVATFLMPFFASASPIA